MTHFFHCHECSLDFLIDLDESECRHCPGCAAPKPTLVQVMTPEQVEEFITERIAEEFREIFSES